MRTNLTCRFTPADLPAGGQWKLLAELSVSQFTAAEFNPGSFTDDRQTPTTT